MHRLKELWRLCHGDRPLRWVSVDQKPSWFNNAGLTGTWAVKGQPMSVREKFAATRQRYSILTSVWWDGLPGNEDRLAADGDEPANERDGRLAASEDGGLPASGDLEAERPGADKNRSPPKFAIMFKGSPDGTIIPKLYQNCDVPPYMLLQAQEHGSYRSEDMVEALDWMLPKAGSGEESMVVMLDWYSGHRTQEVEDLVKGKGHVLIFHGGGTTAFTQVNDTHLHAAYQSLQVSSEVEWTHQERLEALAAGRDRTPVQTRENIVALNRMVWELLPHERLAAIGYKQTGPGLPMEGPWRIEDLGKELGKVLMDLDPSARPGEVGTTVRDEAIAFIRSGWGSQWSSWKDAYEVLQEHDDEDAPVDEGLEGWGYAFEDSDDSGGENDDGDDGPGGGGGGQGGPGGGGDPDGDGGPDTEDDGGGDFGPEDDEHMPEGGGGEGGAGGGEPAADLATRGEAPVATDQEMEEFFGDDWATAAEESKSTSACSQDLRSAAPPPSEGLALATCAAPPVLASEAPPVKVALAPGPSAPSAGGLPSAAPAHVSAAARDEEVAKAREVLIAEARRIGDNLFLRKLLQDQTKESAEARAAALPSTQYLLARMKRERDEQKERAEEKEAKRHRDQLELTEKQRIAHEKAEMAAEARQKALRMTVAARVDLQRRREGEKQEREHQRWLQVDYPIKLARRCMI